MLEQTKLLLREYNYGGSSLQWQRLVPEKILYEGVTNDHPNNTDTDHVVIHWKRARDESCTRTSAFRTLVRVHRKA